VLQVSRDIKALAEEVVAMRHRLQQTYRPDTARFDLKYDAGGMLDVEFAVQYIILAHSNQEPVLCENSGTMALLGVAESLGLLPIGLGYQAAQAYGQLRKAQQQRLQLKPMKVDPQGWKEVRQVVRTLWGYLFPADVIRGGMSEYF
jgi:glutamate-ammonia-ligase adenylyltransferase